MLNKDMKKLIITSCLLFFCGCAVYYAHYLRGFGTPFFTWLKMGPSDYLETGDFKTTYLGKTINGVFYETQEGQMPFLDLTIEDLSPLECVYILNRKPPFKTNLMLDGKPAFFGSSWRCFKQMRHELTIQYELYNTTISFDMKEPPYCKKSADCPYDVSFCFHGYCKKID